MAGSEVAGFYAGRSLLVTGASGFMGKVLVEKLLYSCPDIHQIFILIRPKRGKSTKERLEDMYKSPVFHRIREQKPEAWKKIVPFYGDVLEEGLGLSEEARRRIQTEASVVIHSAASLRLEACLKDAVQMNVLGTYRVLELAKTIKDLKVFVHLSTAFCHVDVIEMEERVYETPISPNDIMMMCEWMDDEILDTIQAKVIHPHPNSYTFSKRLAEALVDNYFQDLPVCIVRPSIVTPAAKEPLPGWVDNLNGPMGVLAGAGKGVIRSMLVNAEYHAEIIPVDFAINIIIIIASKIGSATVKPKELPVFNLTQGKTNPITWGTILLKGKRLIFENPFSLMLWFPDGNIRTNKFVHNLYVVFTHWLPAYLIDGLFFIFRQKRFMLHVQQKISTGLEVLQYFTTRKWIFRNEKCLSLRKELKGSDKETFAFPFEEVEDEPYLKECILGCRHYIMKEDPSTLPKARRTIKMLWLLDRIVTVLFYLFILWMIVSYSDTARAVMDSAVKTIPSIPALGWSVDKTMLS